MITVFALLAVFSVAAFRYNGGEKKDDQVVEQSKAPQVQNNLTGVTKVNTVNPEPETKPESNDSTNNQNITPITTKKSKTTTAVPTTPPKVVGVPLNTKVGASIDLCFPSEIQAFLYYNGQGPTAENPNRRFLLIKIKNPSRQPFTSPTWLGEGKFSGFEYDMWTAKSIWDPPTGDTKNQYSVSFKFTIEGKECSIGPKLINLAN